MKEGLVLFDTIPGEPLSVQGSAPIASRPVERVTVHGYGHFSDVQNYGARRSQNEPLVRAPLIDFFLAECRMRFVLVNGRSPRPRSGCVMCNQQIEAGYLREVGTNLVYCDHDCYADHCKSAVTLLESKARAS